MAAKWTVEQNWSSMSACLCSPDGTETVPISALTDVAVLTIEAAEEVTGKRFASRQPGSCAFWSELAGAPANLKEWAADDQRCGA